MSEVIDLIILNVLGFMLVMVGFVGFFLGADISLVAPAIGVGMIDLMIVTAMLSIKPKTKKKTKRMRR